MFSGTDKFIAFIGFLNFVFFLIFAVSVYEVRRENTRLKREISSNLLRIDVLQKRVIRDFKTSNIEFENVWDEYNELKEKVSILEESIEPKSRRWALIKRVRTIVEEHAKPKLNISDYTYIAGAIVDYSEIHNVPVALILAVMRRESAFNPKAKSYAGAMGIMQVMPATAEDIAAEINKRRYNLYNVKHNVQLGTYYLWKMIDRFDGNIDLAIRAYNCGPICVEQVVAGGWSKYPDQTIFYHKYVMKYKKEFEELGL